MAGVERTEDTGELGVGLDVEAFLIGNVVCETYLSFQLLRIGLMYPSYQATKSFQLPQIAIRRLVAAQWVVAWASLG